MSPQATRSGIRVGDVITAVNGRTVRGMDGEELRELTDGDEGTTVRLTVLQPGQERGAQIRIVRHLVEVPVVKHRLERGGIGYVSLSQFNEIADARLAQAVRDLERKGMRALVLDLRGNPGGLLDSAVDIASRFVPARRKVVTIVEAGGEREERFTTAGKYLGGKWPLVVLVSRTSASATEILSAAIQENNAGSIVGTVTFGKGLVQSVLPLTGGAGCVITTARYLTPRGKDINRSPNHRGGVQPDVTIEVSEEQFRKGEDPQLRRAQELLMEKLARR
jgi:carboxyl-terminal processing protease